MSAPGTILFLCPHNSAKSVLAAADFTRLAAARGLPWRADSAGTDPDVRAAPAVVEALRSEGIDVSHYRPRLVTSRDLSRAHRVISLGCNLDDLPQTTAHIEQWNDIPPVGRGLPAARQAIQRHLMALIAELAEEHA